MIIYIEGSNCSGKTTLISQLEDKYGYQVSKSVPEWFQNYIPFSRSLIPEQQKKIYEVGHISAYEMAKLKDGITIFDRSYISTFIRLSYQEKKSVKKCIEDIDSFPYKPDLLIILSEPYEIVCERYKNIHNNELPNYEFYFYENEIYKQIAKKYDNILLVSNNSLQNNELLENTDKIIKKFYLKRRVKK